MSQWSGALLRVKRKQPMRKRIFKRGLAVEAPSRNVRARVVAPVRGAIPYHGKELKFNDIATAAYAADTTGTVTALNLIATGDDYQTRDGRQVSIKSVQIRGFVSPVDATTVASKARIILVWDNAVNGAIATVADILNAATANSFPLVDNANRFTLLSDQTFFVGGFDTTATTTYAQSPTGHNIEIYRKINQTTQYKNTTSNIASVQNGGLLMVTIGTAAAGAGATFNVATRVRFMDM